MQVGRSQWYQISRWTTKCTKPIVNKSHSSICKQGKFRLWIFGGSSRVTLVVVFLFFAPHHTALVWVASLICQTSLLPHVPLVCTHTFNFNVMLILQWYCEDLLLGTDQYYNRCKVFPTKLPPENRLRSKHQSDVFTKTTNT